MVVTVSNLAGVTEIARELGVPNNQVAMWMARRTSSGFPEPLAVLTRGSVFDLDEVRRWYETKPPPRNRSKEKT
jgi:hypothetical protein